MSKHQQSVRNKKKMIVFTLRSGTKCQLTRKDLQQIHESSVIQILISQ